jgi:hypothetical protein
MLVEYTPSDLSFMINCGLMSAAWIILGYVILLAVDPCGADELAAGMLYPLRVSASFVGLKCAEWSRVRISCL